MTTDDHVYVPFVVVKSRVALIISDFSFKMCSVPVFLNYVYSGAIKFYFFICYMSNTDATKKRR